MGKRFRFSDRYGYREGTMRNETTAIDWAVFVLLLLGLTGPGVMILVGLLDPTNPLDLDGFASSLAVRLLMGAMTILGIAASFGFVLKKRWAWWFVVSWTVLAVLGGLRVVFFGMTGEVAALVFPSVILMYAFLKRDDFGIGLGANKA